VLLCIAHDLSRRVEPHWLRVNQRGGERGRVVMLQPRGDVHDQCETRRMTFGEAVLTEALQLVETPLGKVWLIPALKHAANEAVAEVFEEMAFSFPRGHRTA